MNNSEITPFKVRAGAKHRLAAIAVDIILIGGIGYLFLRSYLIVSVQVSHIAAFFNAGLYGSLVIIGYWLLEAVFRTTPGKWIMGLKIGMANGSPAASVKVLARNLLLMSGKLLELLGFLLARKGVVTGIGGLAFLGEPSLKAFVNPVIVAGEIFQLIFFLGLFGIFSKDKTGFHDGLTKTAVYIVEPRPWFEWIIHGLVFGFKYYYTGILAFLIAGFCMLIFWNTSGVSVKQVVVDHSQNSWAIVQFITTEQTTKFYAKELRFYQVEKEGVSNEFQIPVNEEDSFQKIIALPDGNWMMLGNQKRRIFLQKFSQEGKTLWRKVYFTLPLQNGIDSQSKNYNQLGQVGNDIQMDAQNQIWIAGYVSGLQPKPGNEQGWLIKLSSEGAFLKQYFYPLPVTSVEFSQLKLKQDGNWLVQFNAYYHRYRTLIHYHIDSENGNVLQTNHLQESYSVTGSEFVMDDQENVVVAGNIEEKYSSNFVVLKKISAEGTTLWNKTLDLQYSNYKGPFLRGLSDGGVLLFGQSLKQQDHQSKGAIARFSPEGELIWSKDLGERYEDVLTTALASKGLILAGGEHHPEHSQSEGWLVLLDEQGELLWQEKFTGYPNILVSILGTIGFFALWRGFVKLFSKKKKSLEEVTKENALTEKEQKAFQTALPDISIKDLNRNMSLQLVPEGIFNVDEQKMMPPHFVKNGILHLTPVNYIELGMAFDEVYNISLSVGDLSPWPEIVGILKFSFPLKLSNILQHYVATGIFSMKRMEGTLLVTPVDQSDFDASLCATLNQVLTDTISRNPPQSIVLSLKAIQYIEESGIQWLSNFLALCRETGIGFHVCDLSNDLQKFWKMEKLTDVIPEVNKSNHHLTLHFSFCNKQ
ncbi:MAG: RDD family protein [SAR324 cluster bacterium]|nr:RDD family protein [SAR324 cluster bacterium]